MSTATQGDELAGLEQSVYRESLHEYVKDAWEHIESAPFVDNWHIGALCEHLQAVTRGEIQDLLINIPPGCSKSLLTCVFWPTWEWSIDPSIRWFFSSYDQQLATRDSVKCRTLVSSPWYQRLWPGKVTIKRDQDQKTYYDTIDGGYRLATAVGGHGTGEHPDRIIVDDPHNVRKAESEAERQNVIDWWDLTMPSRGLSRGARRVVIMQRLHHRDLSGHILSRGGFVHICLPMRYERDRMPTTVLGWNDPRTEEGELLAKVQFPEDKVARLEKPLGAYGTAGQLQQRPQPRSGGLFKPQWFNRRERAAPREAVRIRYWDRAATQDGGCYTAGVLLSRSPEDTLYVEDVVHGQWEPNERNDRIVATAKQDRLRYGPRHEPIVYVEAEGGSTGKESFQRLAGRLAGYRVREDRPTGSKDTRAEPWADQLAAGNVVICDNGGNPTWDVDGYIQEHLLFQRDAQVKRLGKYKDQVDASSGACNLIAHIKPVGEMKILRFSGTDRAKHPRMVVCPRNLLASLEGDEKAVIVQIADPYTEPDLISVDEPALTCVLDKTVIQFADLDPADWQDRWHSPVPPFDRLAAELVMTKEDHGRALWRFLTKQRPVTPGLYVFVDPDGRRAESVAKAVSDVLRYPRKAAVHFADPDTTDGRVESAAPNKHVYEVVKASRGLLV